MTPQYKFKRETLIYDPEFSEGLEKIFGQMERAYLVTSYTWPVRVGELVPNKEYPGMQRNRIDYVEEPNRRLLKITLPIEKKRQIGPMVPTHVLWADLDRTPFIDILANYALDKEMDYVLFPITRVTAWTICKRANPLWSPHLFRHVRLQRLRNEQKATGPELQQMAGWSDLRPSGNYLTSTPDDTKRFA